MLQDNIHNILIYAQLSQLVYKKEEKYSTTKINPELSAWEELTIPNVSFEYTADGSEGKHSIVKAMIFKKKKEVVIAFKGTTLSNFDDLKSNLWIALGKTPPRAHEAKIYIGQILEYLKNKNGTLFCCNPYRVVITGHSLGGAIAEWISMKMNLEAYTFDSPGCLIEAKHLSPKIKKRCHNLLSDPNLINSCNSHYGEIYFVSAPKDKSYEDYLQQGIVDSSQFISQSLADTSSASLESSGYSNSIFFPKELVKISLQKTIEHLSGKTLINHTLYTHKLDYMINNLKKEYVKIKPIQHWPEFKKVLQQVGIETDKLPTNLPELIRLIAQLEKTTRHVPNLESKLAMLIEFAQIESKTAIHQNHCIIL